MDIYKKFQENIGCLEKHVILDTDVKKEQSNSMTAFLLLPAFLLWTAFHSILIS